MPANSCISALSHFPVVQEIYLGCCTVAAQLGRTTLSWSAPASHAHSRDIRGRAEDGRHAEVAGPGGVRGGAVRAAALSDPTWRHSWAGVGVGGFGVLANGLRWSFSAAVHGGWTVARNGGWGP
jgi:hypothetical protein